MKRCLITIMLFLAASVTMTSCIEDEGEVISNNPDTNVSHTMVCYFLANNSLSSYIGNNLRDIVMAVDDKFSSSGRVLIYYDRSDSTTLFELRTNSIPSNNYMNRLKVLKTYPTQYSSSPEVMKSVMEDIKTLAPSNSYGLLLSGHGSGWFPEYSSGTIYTNMRVAPLAEHDWTVAEDAEPTRWFGTDGYERIDDSVMSASELIEGISPINFDYIALDACLMSSVEFVYELRNVTDYIVASPVEVLAKGFPFKSIIPSVFGQSGSIEDIAKLFYEYYSTTNETRQSGAIAVIDCAQLDGLAASVKAIYNSSVNTVDESEVQPLEKMSAHVFYDMDSYMSKLCNDESLYANFKAALNKVVVYSSNTPAIYSAFGNSTRGMLVKDINGGTLNLCGLSVYIPREAYPVTKTAYLNTEWAKAVGCR